jgi:hypothetical protein
VIDLDEVLERVPLHDRFLEPGELDTAFTDLVERFPGRARRERVGASAEGRAIDLVTVGHGSRSALLVGVPHPNEPIGTLTALFLARLLCEDEALSRQLDLTLHVVPVADPDGLALNAGWLARPMTLGHYATEFYRPPHHEQVEWSYPVHYETLRFPTPAPETAAVMRVMERTRPELFYSLHNAGFGGVYFYASDDRQSVFARWRALVDGLALPMHQGEPEVPYLESMAPGVYRMFGISDTYDYFARTLGRDPAAFIGAGTSGDDWLRDVRADSFSIVCEVPYFSTPASTDGGPSGRSRRAAICEGLDRAGAVAALVAEAVASLGDAMPDDRLGRSIAAYVDKTPTRLAAERANVVAPEFAREATRGEACDAAWGPLLYHALYVGEVARVAASVGAGALATRLRDEIARIERTLTDEAGLYALPLRRLVQCQAGAGLVAMMR